MYAPEVPRELIEKYNDLPSNYYTVDYAELEDNTWKVIEAGDGSVSGLSEGQSPEHYYRACISASRKHKKIINEIAKTNDVELIDATQTIEKDMSEYDLIGFASGVYGGKFHESVLKFASVNLMDNKKVFLICTYGGRPVFKSIEQVIAYKHDIIVGRFSCKGFDTFGPFRLIGGVSKGHPDEKDIAAAVEFYNGLKD